MLLIPATIDMDWMPHAAICGRGYYAEKNKGELMETEYDN